MKTFRVMQFNMQFGQVWDDADPDHAPVRLEETLREIRRHEPDIVLLQEVEHAAESEVHSAQPPNYTRLRSELSGYDSVFGLPAPDPRELPFGIGLAIFSRTPLTDFVSHVLPSPAIPFDFYGEQKTPTDRLLIAATTELEGRELRLFNVHLLAFFMLKTSSAEHPEQRRRMVNLVSETKGPALIGGDFNVSGHEALIRQFSEAGFSASQSTEITWRRRPYVLDHVFFNRDLRLQRCQVIPTLASDHHVLLSDLSFA